MDIKKLHPWNVSPKEAVEIQKQLQPQVILKNRLKRLRFIAGTDVASSRTDDTLWAGVVVLQYPGLEPVEQRWTRGKTSFPYIPGLLSFREIPILVAALNKLKTIPDLILCDGQGIAHPRGLGLATHLGLLVNSPTIGCAKSRLVGSFTGLGKDKGDSADLVYSGRVIGAAARTRTGIKPIFISVGNNITLKQSLRIVFRCCPRYRVPEPIRMAHFLVTRLRAQHHASAVPPSSALSPPAVSG
ncbi:MAG: endonuclease [Deltaproteobacteria bacterium]|nr:endonuclease [Deltaproteobacteria bacterium]